MQQQYQKPMTSSELLEKTNQFIDSVMALEIEFENFLSDKEVGDDVEKLIECQNQFWNESVSILMDEISQDDSGGDIPVLLWNNCFFTRFYEEKIFGDWSDLELRKLTILLGIHNLEKFIKSRAIEKEAETIDGEPHSDTDSLKSEPREISKSPLNSSTDIEPKTVGDRDGEHDDDSSSKAIQAMAANDLLQNSQTENGPATSDEDCEEEEDCGASEWSDDEIDNIEVIINVEN